MKILEGKIVLHCAPTLKGLKPANMVSLSHRQIPQLSQKIHKMEQQLHSTGIRFQILRQCRHRILLLVYRLEELTALIQQPANTAYLLQRGYPLSHGSGFSLDLILSYLSHRICQEEEFPHETGIFLGYPLCDVMGFEKYRGQNCKLCGYWKVYDNVDQTRNVFRSYRECQTSCYNAYLSGTSFLEMLQIA